MSKGPVTEESTASMKTWKKTRVGRAERAKRSAGRDGWECKKGRPCGILKNKHGFFTSS